MAKLKQVFRGLSMVFAVGLAVSIAAGQVMEQFWPQMDTIFHTLSYETIMDADETSEWAFESQFKTPTEAVEGLKKFAIEASTETYALLKNENKALPLAKDAKITMMGVRSYAPVYGSSAGSIPGFPEINDGNKIFEAFKGRGFQLNPSMLKAYENYFSDQTWGAKGFVSTAPEYSILSTYTDIPELSPSELAEQNAEYQKDFASYNDAAILVFGRPGGEGKAYNPGTEGRHTYTTDRQGNVTADFYSAETNTNNILGLSVEELELVKLAKENFNKVVVLINSACQMDIADIAADKAANNYGVDAILWIGYPGSYGFWGVADVLNGTVSPSAHLGDTYAKNGALAPAMMNFGSNTPWTDKPAGDNINTYLIEAEGIYTGYRYYETRYADVVNGVAGAATAKAGTYANADGTPATTDGTWSYANEVVYTFGRGLSYTTFEQKLMSVGITEDKQTATVAVQVTNKGDYAGKSVVQVYGQAPYTQYDKENNIEKSAIQLLDFEKTDTLAPGQSTIVTLYVDMANIASYDIHARNGKGGFVVEAGDYFISIGDDAHDALNNVLAAQGKKVSDGMTAEGDASKTYKWTWGKDEDTFSLAYSSTADNPVYIENHLTEGIYAMDFNYFSPGSVTYLSRKDWNGTFPKTYTGFTGKESAELEKALGNNFVEYKTDATEGQFKWGVDSGLTIYDLPFVDWDDPRLDQIVDQVDVQEFFDYLPMGLHKFPALPSLGIDQMATDDGPGGADEHYIGKHGGYHGEAYAEMEDYNEKWEEFGTRVAPAPINIAYSFNKELSYEKGQLILGESQLMFNLAIMIGPGGNIHRHAYNARGCEYYSEDPILSGYIGSAVVQGAQDKGCLVNIKHAAFNDQEINRSGVAPFTTEQAARELELRNLEQMFTAQGKPAAWQNDIEHKDLYTQGALGVMTSYNRIGAVASSANKGVMQDIMRGEWGFKGYNQTDMTGISAKAAPHESLLYGTTGFCGGGSRPAHLTVEAVKADAELSAAIKMDIKYIVYALTHTSTINAPQHTEWRMSSWRQMSYALIGVTAGLTVLSLGAYVALSILKKEEN